MRVESVSDKMTYIILRSRSWHVIVLSVHASTKDTIDVEDSFYVEPNAYLGNSLKSIWKRRLKISMESRQDVHFKPKIQNEIYMVTELE
jgi:hypothetical protein